MTSQVEVLQPKAELVDLIAHDIREGVYHPRERLIEVEQVHSFGVPSIKLSLRDAQPRLTNRLTQGERDFIGAFAEWVCGFNSSALSELQWRQPWITVKLGERIPYASAVLLLPRLGPAQREPSAQRRRA